MANTHSEDTKIHNKKKKCLAGKSTFLLLFFRIAEKAKYLLVLVNKHISSKNISWKRKKEKSAPKWWWCSLSHLIILVVAASCSRSCRDNLRRDVLWAHFQLSKSGIAQNSANVCVFGNNRKVKYILISILQLAILAMSLCLEDDEEYIRMENNKALTLPLLATTYLLFLSVIDEFTVQTSAQPSFLF